MLIEFHFIKLTKQRKMNCFCFRAFLWLIYKPIKGSNVWRARYLIIWTKIWEQTWIWGLKVPLNKLCRPCFLEIGLLLNHDILKFNTYGYFHLVFSWPKNGISVISSICIYFLHVLQAPEPPSMKFIVNPSKPLPIWKTLGLE